MGSAGQSAVEASISTCFTAFMVARLPGVYMKIVSLKSQT